jgi:hypothetical protein
MIIKTVLFLAAAFVWTFKLSAQHVVSDHRIDTLEHETSSPVGIRIPTEKGNWMLGSNLLLANMSFGGGASGHYSSYDLSISPRIGYFVKDDFAMGMTLSYNTAGQTRRFNSSSVGANVFGRYYLGKSITDEGELKKLRFFLETGAGLNSGRGTFTNPDGNKVRGQFSNYSAYIMPGASYFINKNVALEGSIYFQHNGSLGKNSVQNPGRDNRIGFNLGLNIFIGKR